METKTNTKPKRPNKLALLLFFVLSTFMSTAQNSRTTLQSISSDKLTSQEQKDELKKQWIENHKEEYIKMGGSLSNNSGNSTSSKAPEFNTEAQKAEWLKSQEPKKETVIFPKIPSFPKFENTGNPLVDNENYRVKKDEWIKNHPAEYNGMNQLSNSDSKKRVKPVINE